MVNDTTTLNGALMELGELMAENLTTQGLIGVSASDGLTTLANDILLIQGGGGGGGDTQVYYDLMNDSTTISNYNKTGNANMVLERSGDDHFYVKLTGNNIVTWTVNNLTVGNKVRITCDWFMGSNSSIQAKLLLYDPTLQNGYSAKMYRSTSKLNINTHTLTSEGTSIAEDTLATSTFTWYTCVFTIDEDSLQYDVYSESGTLLKTVTTTGSLNLSSSGNLVGFAFAENSNSDAYIRKFKVETLGDTPYSPCAEYMEEISDAITYINGSGS